jgi:Tol biopolymer transport system component
MLCGTVKTAIRVVVCQRRHFLIDAVRAQNFGKRDGHISVTSVDDETAVTAGLSVDLIALDEALARLAQLNARQSRVVELRFFVGLSYKEIAEVMKISPGAAQNRQINVTRLIGVGDVNEAAISPDGRYVAYTAGRAEGRSLRVLEVETGVDAPLFKSSSGYAYQSPAFTPDGGETYYLAYESDRDLKALYRIPRRGREARRVLERIDGSVTFAPDGKWLAYYHRDPREGSTELWRTPLDGGRRRRLTGFELYSVSRFARSRDGSRLVVSLLAHSRDVVLIRNFK